jgi:hypothetical protein
MVWVLRRAQKMMSEGKQQVYVLNDVGQGSP